jgi:hypothetical protein
MHIHTCIHAYIQEDWDEREPGRRGGLHITEEGLGWGGPLKDLKSALATPELRELLAVGAKMPLTGDVQVGEEREVMSRL